MSLKRIKFAFIICAFVLYGCTSSASVIQKPDVKGKETSKTSSNVITNKMILVQNTNMKDYVEKMNKKLEEERIQREKKEQEKQNRLKEMEESSTDGFYPIITTYGVDCYGCGGESGRGNTAVGVELDATLGVKMSDGTWQEGIRYGDYYIVAADPSIPFCSILKISNHGLSGSGISPDEPYYAIVLDRGGAIQGGHIDLYIGTENSNAIVPVKQSQAYAQILRMGGKQGSKSCAL